MICTFCQRFVFTISMIALLFTGASLQAALSAEGAVNSSAAAAIDASDASLGGASGFGLVESYDHATSALKEQQATQPEGREALAPDAATLSDFAVNTTPNTSGMQPVNGDADSAIMACINSFNETRERILTTNTQSVILHSNANGISPFIVLQIVGSNGSHYVLWQNLNGDIRGYALRNGEGFDYANSANTPLPLAWHPTLIWDHLFGSTKELKNYSCVLTGRTRVMGKRVSLLRLIPQEGLRYSFLLAKEDESDFPVELSVIDPKGVVLSRLTTMDSRIIAGGDFPIHDLVFDRIAESQANGTLTSEGLIGSSATNPAYASSGSGSGNGSGQSLSALADDKVQVPSPTATATSESEVPDRLNLVLPAPTASAGATMAAGSAGTGSNMPRTAAELKAAKLKAWPELNIPQVYTIIGEGHFTQGGQQCIYQEFSDGLTSFRVYRNQRSSSFYPVLTNGTISIVRKNTLHYEYAVVGEVPVALAEFVLTKIND